ncbi:LytTR family DNA-binding domain-containing protein [Bacteroides fragilis]
MLKRRQSLSILQDFGTNVSSLNPEDFIRANKQFIVARNSVTDITIWFDNRLLITLDTEVPERIYVSKNKASEFKTWLVNDK